MGHIFRDGDFFVRQIFHHCGNVDSIMAFLEIMIYSIIFHIPPSIVAPLSDVPRFSVDSSVKLTGVEGVLQDAPSMHPSYRPWTHTIDDGNPRGKLQLLHFNIPSGELT